jgi:hypothetical protein
MTMSKDRKGFFHYLFTTALEGGIGYWSNCQEYHWSKPDESVAMQIRSGVEWKNTKVRIEDLDNFYAIIESSEGDWGVYSAYQPNMSGMEEDSGGIVFLPEECKNQYLRIVLKVI